MGKPKSWEREGAVHEAKAWHNMLFADNQHVLFSEQHKAFSSPSPAANMGSYGSQRLLAGAKTAWGCGVVRGLGSFSRASVGKGLISGSMLASQKTWKTQEVAWCIYRNFQTGMETWSSMHLQDQFMEKLHSVLYKQKDAVILISLINPVIIHMYTYILRLLYNFV